MHTAPAQQRQRDDIVAALPLLAPPVTRLAVDPPLPLPTIPDHDHLPTATYALARIDTSGRVADHTTPHTLGWQAGDPLSTTLEDNTIVVRHEPAARTRLSPKRHVVIPAALRHRCGIRPGDLVFLVALPDDNVLRIHTLDYLDRLYTSHTAP